MKTCGRYVLRPSRYTEEIVLMAACVVRKKFPRLGQDAIRRVPSQALGSDP
jgi:hypothetical protein